MHKKDNRARYICLIIVSHYLKKRRNYATPFQSLIKALHNPVHIAQFDWSSQRYLFFSNNHNTLYEMIRTIFMRKIFRDFSEILPRLFKKSSETFQKFFRDFSEILPRLKKNLPRLQKRSHSKCKKRF